MNKIIFIFLNNNKMNKYYQLWSINQKLNNPDISRYISTFISYKPITRIIMKLKIKNNKFEDMKDGYGPIENWNVQNIINMSNMFFNCNNFNQDLSMWNVQNVQDMSSMFCRCFKFNQNLSNWNVQNVINMNYMFYNCYYFNQDLSKWNVQNVTNMSYMFYNCYKFNQDLSKWNVQNVTDMSS